MFSGMPALNHQEQQEAVERIHQLIAETAKILSDDPLFYLVNSYTTGLSGSAVSYLVNEEIVSRFGGKISKEKIARFWLSMVGIGENSFRLSITIRRA